MIRMSCVQWKKYTDIKGFSDENPQPGWFWKLVEESSPEFRLRSVCPTRSWVFSKSNTLLNPCWWIEFFSSLICFHFAVISNFANVSGFLNGSVVFAAFQQGGFVLWSADSQYKKTTVELIGMTCSYFSTRQTVTTNIKSNSEVKFCKAGFQLVPRVSSIFTFQCTKRSTNWKLRSPMLYIRVSTLEMLKTIMAMCWRQSSRAWADKVQFSNPWGP